MGKWLTAFLMALLLASISSAGSIYIWTDADGVKRFSDQPPPDSVKNYDVIQGTIPPSDSDQRPAFEQMVQQVEQENKRSDLERQKEAAEKRAAEREKQEAERKARIQAEHDRLQEKIDELNNRALSPTFTQGMRQAQIDTIQKEINKLYDASDKQQTKRP